MSVDASRKRWRTLLNVLGAGAAAVGSAYLIYRFYKSSTQEKETAEVSTDLAPLRDAVGSAERQHANSEQEKPSRPGGGAGGGRAGTEPAGHVLSTPKRDTWRDAGVEQAGQSPQANGLVQSMLSQETLFTPLRQRESYYTKFLAERGENLPEDELNRYRRQFGLVKKICEVLEKEPFDVNKLLYLMQLLQDSGDPPPDVNSLTAAH